MDGALHEAVGTDCSYNKPRVTIGYYLQSCDNIGVGCSQAPPIRLGGRISSRFHADSQIRPQQVRAKSVQICAYRSCSGVGTADKTKARKGMWLSDSWWVSEVCSRQKGLPHPFWRQTWSVTFNTISNLHFLHLRKHNLTSLENRLMLLSEIIWIYCEKTYTLRGQHADWLSVLQQVVHLTTKVFKTKQKTVSYLRCVTVNKSYLVLRPHTQFDSLNYFINVLAYINKVIFDKRYII